MFGEKKHTSRGQEAVSRKQKAAGKQRTGRLWLLPSAFCLLPWVLGGSAHGQSPFYQVRPGLTIGQYATNLATIGQALSTPYVNRAAQAYASNAAYASPYSYNPYYPFYQDPYSAYLQGGADLTAAQGQFMVNQQQAFQMREQVRSARLDNRRKAFDEYLYERERTPTPEEERQRFLRQQLLRSRNNPPLTEVWSGQALNTLLADLRKNLEGQHTATLHTFNVPLDDEGLRNINLTRGAGSGSLGILKTGSPLNWPLALNGQDYREQRERVNTLAQEALKQAQFNQRVDAGTLQQLDQEVGTLQRQLRRDSGELTFEEYRDAKTFLNNLEAAVKALGQPDVGNYFNGKYALGDVKTVPQLVRRMADAGLTFAPAVPGQEAAYSALHQALAAYDTAVHAEVAR